MPINIDSITLQGTLMSKVLKSSCKKLLCLSTIPIKHYSINFVGNLHADCYAKNQLTPKVILSICRKLLCLHAGKKKKTSISMFAWILCKIWDYVRYVNILFWILWGCLDTHNKNDMINL